MGHKKLAIIIPAANEEDIIIDFYKDLLFYIKKFPYTTHVYFIVDNISKDKTLEILRRIAKKNSLIKVLYAPGNKNVVDAYVKGYKEALKSNADYIIEMDCGFSHLPKELYKFIEGLEEGNDAVFGIRPLWSLSYPAPMKRRIYSLGGTLLANMLLGTRLKDMTSGYEAFTQTAAKKIFHKPLKSTGHFFQTEVRYRARKLRYKEVTIQYNFPSPRVRANSIYNSFETLFSLWRNRITNKRD